MLPTPRRWQAECLAELRRLAARNQPCRPMVRACMGSGKSYVIAKRAQELADEGLFVTITTPRLALVEQLAATCRMACGDAGCMVGAWSGQFKQLERVTVCCDDSLASLAEVLNGPHLIIDEAHRSESPSYLEAVERLDPASVTCFSATPWRADRRECISLADVLAYDYGPSQAYADGVCVPPSVESYTGEDGASVDDVTAAWLRSVKLPSIVNARSIDDAERYAAKLHKSGRIAVAVTSRSSREQIKHAFELSRRGACLVHCNLLVDGVDLPWIGAMALRRQYSSSVRAAQEIGRGLRAFHGKTCLRLFDPLDQWGTFALDASAVLDGMQAEAAPVGHGIAGDRRILLAEDPALVGIGPGSLVRVWPPRRPAAGARTRVKSLAYVNGAWLVDVLEDIPQGAIELRSTEWRPIDAKRRELVAASAVSVPALEAWLKAEAAMLAARGVIDEKCRSRGWRKEPQTDKQAGFRDRLIGGVAKHSAELRPDVRRLLGLAIAARAKLSRGGATDLISVMLGTVKGALAVELDAAEVKEPAR